MQNYAKLPKTPPDIIAKLKNQGLNIADIGAAQKFLSKVSYYRFRGYLYPYFDLTSPEKPRKFQIDSTFEKAWEMYCFDESLRKLIFNIFPEIEVSLRTALDIAISPVANHGFWYLEKSWISSKKNEEFNQLLCGLERKFNKSKETYIEHYRTNYFNNVSREYKHLPPFWIISELATLGELKILFEILDEKASNFGATSTVPKSTILDKMAHQFGAAHYRELVNWVHVLRDLRNLCAHHGRLWNRNLPASQGISSKLSKPLTISNTTSRKPENSVYAAIVVLRIMCQHQSIHDGLKDGLLTLFTRFPESLNHRKAMGMPPDWSNDRIWL